MIGFYKKSNTVLKWVNVLNKDLADQEFVQSNIIITLFHCYYFEQGFNPYFIQFLFAAVIG